MANDAQEVKKALAMCYKQGLTDECKGCVYKGHGGICIDALLEDALALINSLESCIDAQSTVDATEEVHGRWISVDDSLFPGTKEKCSLCGVHKDFGYVYHYCPNCGAKMDGDGNV